MMNTDNVELTISLRHDLAHTIKCYADDEGKTLEEFIISALWQLRKERGMRDLKRIQSYWSQRAEELGIYTEEDLFRYLES